MSHWTKQLKTENAALRAALDIATAALRNIPQSRLNKEAAFPHEDGAQGLAYRTCAEEVDRLGLAALTLINDKLAEAGV